MADGAETAVSALTPEGCLGEEQYHKDHKADQDGGAGLQEQ